MNKEEWEPIDKKESHENKTLLQHINEIKNVYLPVFLKNYSFSDDIKKAIEYVIEYHDYGKLHRSWNIRKENNPSHSLLSVKYIIENKCFPKLDDKQLILILIYLIYKHHSFLSKVLYEEKIKRELGEYSAILDVENIKAIISNLYNKNMRKLIDLVDLFGLFKICDLLSAKNFKREELEKIIKKPLIREEEVKNIILLSRKNFNEKRWYQQQKLKELPDIAILRAYTGWGKTDTALMFFTNRNVSRIFFLLPTITAINKFYNKLRHIYSEDIIKYFYFYDTEVSENLDLIQNFFLFENFLRPLVVTTIDQFLLSFLQIGKYYTKRVMFRSAGLILDEIHLLNPMMLFLFTYFVKNFNQIYNFKILMMSATFSEALKKYLLHELNFSTNSILDFFDEYRNKRRIMFEYVERDIEESIDEIIEEFKRGKKVLVILNTVEKSISITKKLTKEVDRQDIILIHSRFMYKDRIEKEKNIDKKSNKPHILVSTQVCEVSLDVNYDVLFTELAPISSLIQRFGRVNRYGDRIQNINVKIFRPDIKDKKKYPYTSDELRVAEKIIKELQFDNLKSEYTLLEIYNSELSYERFLKIIDKEAKGRINLNEFESRCNFFFSLDVSDKEIAEILNYRDSFTSLIIPSPECILDKNTSNIIENLLNVDLSRSSFEKIKQFLATIKKFVVPVPIWWIGKEIKEEMKRRKVFPVIYSKRYVYDSFYGFIENNENIFIIM